MKPRASLDGYMAGDATIQAAIQTLLQALTRYGSADVSLGDTRILGNKSGPWAIIFPGRMSAERVGAWGQVMHHWRHDIDLWRKFAGDSYADIVADRQAVVDCIMQNPTLNGTTYITDSSVVDSTEPRYMWLHGQPKTAKPQFVGFRIAVETGERLTHDRSGEFA